MRQIPLTQGKFALVDDEDFERVNQWKWHYHNGYAQKHLTNTGHPRQMLLHRFLMGSPKGKEIDHKDGNGLNNQKKNLRICTRKQNRWNVGLNKNNKSGFKGVSWSKERKRYITRIRTGTRYLYLKSSKDIIVAAKAYNKAAKKIHGKFARLNKI